MLIVVGAEPEHAGWLVFRHSKDSAVEQEGRRQGGDVRCRNKCRPRKRGCCQGGRERRYLKEISKDRDSNSEKDSGG